jgi:hypothetical protein
MEALSVSTLTKITFLTEKSTKFPVLVFGEHPTDTQDYKVCLLFYFFC